MKCTSHRLRLRVLSAGIALCLIVQTTFAGQSPTGLAIQILEASAGQNIIAEELPPIKVRVMDRTGRVLPGANVLFAAPEEGPTGHFLPNDSQVSVTTDTQGMATAPRFRTNSMPGEYEIQIVASYRDSVSRIAIPQHNVLKKKASKKKLLILSAVIGGAAAAAFAAKGGASGPAASALGALSTPTITLGESSASAPSTILAIGTSLSGSSAPTTSGGTTSSTTSTFTGVSSSVQPIPQTQPPVSSVCAGMPPNSNRRDCR